MNNQISHGIQSMLDEYLKNVAIRLAKTYEKYVEGECGAAEYLIALRSFMLSYQVPIRFEEANTFQDLDQYGIYCDVSGRKYYAVYDTPQYVPRKKFVSDAFVDINSTIPERKSKYNLKNIMKYIDERKELNIISFNMLYFEAAEEAF